MTKMYKNNSVLVRLINIHPLDCRVFKELHVLFMLQRNKMSTTVIRKNGVLEHINGVPNRKRNIEHINGVANGKRRKIKGIDTPQSK